MKKSLFVTVGTTKFPKLIKTVTSKRFLDTLASHNFGTVQLQIGKNHSRLEIDPRLCTGPVNNQTGPLYLKNGLVLHYSDYYDDIKTHIQKCDLVISHAGAGTCLETLHAGITLIAVINDDLMDNHQTELAEELDSQGYLYCCTCETLSVTLEKDFDALIPYPRPGPQLFRNYLDKCVGFN